MFNILIKFAEFMELTFEYFLFGPSMCSIHNFIDHQTELDFDLGLKLYDCNKLIKKIT